MVIKINQKLPTCDLCGKVLPFNDEKIIKLKEGEKVLKLCSNKCKDIYIKKYGVE